MERRSRAALKKAPVHVVLSLELQALQLVEQVRGGFPGGGAGFSVRQAPQHPVQSGVCVECLQVPPALRRGGAFQQTGPQSP